MITDPKSGVFPESGEIKFNCNCPDYAGCCKHVAATLYGIGVHFDEDPMLFFLLRGQDPKELIAEASKDLAHSECDADNDIEDLFGIEIDEQLSAGAVSRKGKKSKKESASKSKKATAMKKKGKATVATKKVSKKVTKKKVAKKQQATKKVSKKSTSIPRLKGH